jgi:hypothetical protein
MPHGLKNIPLRIFRQYLESKDLKIIRKNSGHEIWGGKCLKRPITLQSHIDPVPEFVVKNSLNALNVDKEDFFSFFDA